MNEEINNWLLAPVTDCVLYLTEEVTYSGLLRRGLISMTGMRPFFTLAHLNLEAAGVETINLRKMIDEYLNWENTAKEHVENDFSIVHRHSLVGLWCVMENMIEDSLILILEKYPDAEEKLLKAGYIPKPSNLQKLNYYQLQRVYSGLERQARDHGNIAEAWVHLLGVMDVNINLPKEITDTIAEINEVRNCILHRRGKIDEKAALKAPALKSFVNQEISIGEQHYLTYYNAMGKFVVSMIEAVTKSLHCKWKPIT